MSIPFLGAVFNTFVLKIKENLLVFYMYMYVGAISQVNETKVTAT